MRLIDPIKLKQALAVSAILEDKKTIEQIIDDQPTIEERKMGRWIHDGYAFEGGIDWMHCSECGHNDSWSVATRTPYCAWCGARMMEDNNETD